MQVAPLEKVNALELRIKALEDMLNQIMSAKVSVEWVGMETAEVILNVSRTTIWRLIKRNELAILKTGRKIQVGLNSIRAYLLKNKYEPLVVEARINSLLAA